ncbi:TRAP transporter substrate-binding protein [Ammoniphilus sp. YIM 78166]|uniref:TRAP transporter substrate-binding protein n=1 Tax=Ammoniphilus sp. YIM 78166 TaxID=1644106 RepID=UPI00106F5F66|nr:TRAP transporter substrate-binding protein [Ammoniphilus sp. YIM 78166]
MKLGRKLNVLLSSALSILVLLAGCGGNPASTSKNASAPANTPASVNTTSQPSGSGEKVVMKLGHVNAPDHHYQLTALEFAKLVKEKSKGKIEVELFPQSQLGGEVKMIQALKTGTQDLLITSQAPMTNSVPEWGIFDLPYLFDSDDQANKILQGPTGEKFLDMLQNQNIVGLAWFASLERNVFTSKKPVKTLEDIKTLKLRVIQSSGYVDAFKAVGANPTPLAYSELYLALQQGVVDGADTSPDQFILDKFYETSKYFSLTRMHYMPIAFMASKVTWDKLSPDLQQVMQEAAKEAAQFNIKTFKKSYTESLEEMKKKGTEVIEVDTKPWIQATEAARSDLLKKIPNGDALYKEIMDAKK